MFRTATGPSILLKEGNRFFSGNDEALLRSIDACKKFGDMMKSSYGPCGTSKLISNFIDKRFLTGNGDTIIDELEITHPAMKLLKLHAKIQKVEFGDNSKFVIILASELLKEAEEFLNQGLTVPQIIKGYEKTVAFILENWDNLFSLNKNYDEAILKPIIASKIRDNEAISVFSKLVMQAVNSINREGNKSFNTDDIRLVKVRGASLSESFYVNGMVLKGTSKTNCKNKKNFNVIVLAQPLALDSTETSGTVLLKNVDDLLAYSKNEEDLMKDLIEKYKNNGVEGIVCGGTISPIALHYLNLNDMWAFVTSSKFDIKRIAKSLGVTAMERKCSPSPDEIGKIEFVEELELGSEIVTIIKPIEKYISSIVFRGPVDLIIDDYERALKDCISLTFSTNFENKFTYGAGWFEYYLSKKIQNFASSVHGNDGFVINGYANALSSFLNTIAVNVGYDYNENLIDLIQTKEKEISGYYGINAVTVDKDQPIRDVSKELESNENYHYPSLNFPVYDHLATKKCAITLATNVTLKVLSIQQIIMSKPSGGPKFPEQGHWDEADDRAGFNQ